MSNRSTLVSPSTESGGVGSIISVDSIISPPLIDDAFYTTASFQIPAGVWSITMAQKLEITNGTVVGYSNNYLQTSTLLGATSNWLINEYYNTNPVALVGTLYQERSSTIVLRLTEQTIVNSIVQVGFSGGSGITSQPIDGSSGALWAIKLA